MPELAGRTYVITGASRGIGRAIALRLAREGANLVIAAKTVKPHPKLPGTIHTVAEEVETAGGDALPVAVDVRDEEQVRALMDAAASCFGGIDGVVNNAGAIRLTPVASTPIKAFDLMHAVNSRATFLCSTLALPWLKQSPCPHILNLSPPLSLAERWLAPHAPYTISKYGMSMLTLGMSAEFAPCGIAVNSLWPRTIIATAAIEFALADRDAFDFCRTPEIMADAAREILGTPDRAWTGRCFLDEEVLRERGVTDWTRYAVNPAHADRLIDDLFVEPRSGTERDRADPAR